MKLFIKILFIIFLSLIALVTIVIFTFGTNVDNVVGISMNPSFYEGDIIVTNEFLNIHDGDVIIFNCISDKCSSTDDSDYDWMIKRVTSINNDCYFVEGDNREYSFDSNDYGWICLSKDIELISKVIFKLSGGTDSHNTDTTSNDNYVEEQETISQPHDVSTSSGEIKPGITKSFVNVQEETKEEIKKKKTDYDKDSDREFKEINDSINEPTREITAPSLPAYKAPPTPEKIDMPEFSPRICITQNGVLVCNHD